MESRVEGGDSGETKASSEQQCKEMESRVEGDDSGETKDSSEQQCKEMESRVEGGDSGETKASSEQDAADSLTDAEKAREAFVIQHRPKLIQKVTTVMPIVDSLRTMVHPELYAKIKAKETSMDQMRELYTMVLDPGGTVVKTAFYNALEQHEPHLLERLGPVLPSEDSAKHETQLGCQQLKSYLKKELKCLEDWTQISQTKKKQKHLNEIFTEVYITEGSSAQINNEHEVRQIETAFSKQNSSETPIQFEDIFEPLPGEDEPIRTVMMKGVAGIGKTVVIGKHTLDWAEEKANQSIHFIFPFTFRGLNLVKEDSYSLVELLQHFFSEINLAGICSKGSQVEFIFDGLDECRFFLNFQKKEILTDVTKRTSVDVLVTNLIMGNLLPSARIWITSRPAAANQIPDKYVDRVTELRGFTDPQKEEYFNKRFSDDENQARTIFSHVEKSRSLHIMCYLPVFCWITATVLESILRTEGKGALPKTQTEMYIHFVVVQSKHQNTKNKDEAQTHSDLNPDNIKTILSLGKLAFEQLEKGNLIFNEDDLTESGIDIKDASVYSGVFTQMFKEERGLHNVKVFCFVHLSVQEFLAALYVFLTFINRGVNLLSQTTSKWSKLFVDTSKLNYLYQSAVDKALQSPNGHYDLFLRFLLGLSMENNQTLLNMLLKQKKENASHNNQKIVKYIKKKIRENSSQERTINLLHCLNELNDHSLEEEIQQYLSSGSLSKGKLSPAQWSTLVFMLLSSQKELDVFDLKKYSGSAEALLRLLPVVKASNRALLSGCNLSERCCKMLSSVISSSSCRLKELDLSHNELLDSGVKLIADGLGSSQCSLETLRLSGCMVSEVGCSYLVAALKSNRHLKVLDLSFNHPGGDSEEQLRSAGQLETISVDHCGACRLKPGVRKYVCELTLDPNTAYRYLSLSEDNTKVTWVKEEQPYPDHPDRFDYYEQVLCRESLIGRCYWEVEWSGVVNISVTHRGINRKGKGKDCELGQNDKSWSLVCYDGIRDSSYDVCHNEEETKLSVRPNVLFGSDRVGVYVDCPNGTLSFYKVSSDTLTHMHTVHSTFTEPLCAGFWCYDYGSSVSLCQI